MNTIYKVVWNAASGKYVVASELAKGCKKTSRKALVSALAIAFAASAPFGAVFAADSTSSTVCIMPDGRSGTLDTAGVCTVETTRSTGGSSSGGDVGVLGGGFSNGAGISIQPTGGAGATATGQGDIAIGNVSSATGVQTGLLWATAVGDTTVANAADASAFGNRAQATAAQASAVGAHAVANGAGATAVGVNSHSAGAASIAIGGSATTGSGAQALALHSIAIGEASIANAAASVAVGEGAMSYGSGSVVMGSGARDSTVGGGAFNSNAVVIGNGANVTGASDSTGGGMALGNGAAAYGTGVALGSGATASGSNLVALGANANATASGSTAIGANARVNAGATLSTAIGNGAVIGEDVFNSVALGAQSTTDRNNAVAVGSTTTQRQIVNVAAGTQATDAVIVSQLQPALTALGATLDPTTGLVTAPTYTTVNGGTSTTLQGALTGLDNALTTTNTNVTHNADAITNIQSQLDDGTVGLVQQSAKGANLTVGANTDGAAVDFTGTAGTRTLTGLKNGEVSAASQDAINGSQLHGLSESVAGALGGNATVNADGSITAPTYTLADGSTVTGIGNMFTHIDGRVSTNEGAISGLADQLNSGSVGLVQQASAGANLTVGAGTGGAAVDFTGTNGMRILTGVANGVGDDDVVTMSQLKAAGLLDPSGDPMTVISYDDHSLASATLGGSNGTLLNNVAAGQIASGSMQAVNGGQLFDVQQSFQSQYDFLSNQYGNLNDRVGTIEQGIADGAIGGGGGVDPALPGSGEGSTQ
ncbi:MAG TPA: ESPR-type extended signal peptide-containing protein, partial [Dyella sp.]|uniref:ESPR-type extended signal peptide-containing protein n=1 Tax=Dyella sp. TaxID=1869338 RepID=UPI002C9CB768